MNKNTLLDKNIFFEKLEQKKMIYLDLIKYSLTHYNLSTKGKKKELIKRLYFYFNEEYYMKNIDKIILLQNNFRKIKHLIKTKKENNKLDFVNTEDFYTLEPLLSIDKDFLFFFIDNDKYKYGFDIRSFKKLVENNSINPYNRNKIPETAIQKMEKQFKVLNLKKKIKKEKKPKFTDEQIFKNKLVEIFQKIDMMNVAAGGIPIHWFTDLSFLQLKNFYRVLEDIWNYRAELTLEKKKEIVPNNNIFRNSINYIMNIKKKRDLEKIILNEIDKLISSSENIIHRNTGCYYVLIALTEISHDCAIAMPWLTQY